MSDENNGSSDMADRGYAAARSATREFGLDAADVTPMFQVTPFETNIPSDEFDLRLDGEIQADGLSPQQQAQQQQQNQQQQQLQYSIMTQGDPHPQHFTANGSVLQNSMVDGDNQFAAPNMASGTYGIDMSSMMTPRGITMGGQIPMQASNPVLYHTMQMAPSMYSLDGNLQFVQSGIPMMDQSMQPMGTHSVMRQADGSMQMMPVQPVSVVVSGQTQTNRPPHRDSPVPVIVPMPTASDPSAAGASSSTPVTTNSSALMGTCRVCSRSGILVSQHGTKYICDECRRVKVTNGVLAAIRQANNKAKPSDQKRGSDKMKDCNNGASSASQTPKVIPNPEWAEKFTDRKMSADQAVKLIVEDVKRRKRTGSKDAEFVKGYPCYFEGCGKVFTRPSHLKKHLYIHTGERPHKCNLCEDAFKTKWTLKKHIRTHTGEKPFSCPQCKMDFTQRGSWRRHMLAHDAQSSHTCPCCHRTFKQLANLTKHVRTTHADESTVSCTVCGSIFLNATALAAHTASVHPETAAKLQETQMFGCPYCTTRFIGREDCVLHMRTCKSAPSLPVTPFVKTGLFTDSTGPPPIFYGTQSVLS